MMDWTDRHYRYFMRQITKRTLLYTPMITTQAILHGDRKRLLDYSPIEHPLALQLGGDNPRDLAASARIAEEWGYDEVNLNVGCPSDRVQEGNFGACLMAKPEHVVECIGAMKAAVQIPVTIKHRIGIDDMDSYEHMAQFVRIVSEANCDVFIIHARKAWLQGLSPKENRTVPPLRYDEIYQVKKEFPHLSVVLNGGVRSLEEMQKHLRSVDGVMIGRAAYEDPYLFADVDERFFGEKKKCPSRKEILQRMLPYIEENVTQHGLSMKTMTRHMLGLFHGVPGARTYRRLLSDGTPSLDQLKFLQLAVERGTPHIE